jgi:hypothetical protein
MKCHPERGHSPSRELFLGSSASVAATAGPSARCTGVRDDSERGFESLNRTYLKIDIAESGLSLVIPAQARSAAHQPKVGHPAFLDHSKRWIPACAGMTIGKLFES